MTLGAFLWIMFLTAGSVLHTLMYQALSRRIRALEKQHNKTGEGWS